MQEIGSVVILFVYIDQLTVIILITSAAAAIVGVTGGMTGDKILVTQMLMTSGGNMQVLATQM